MKFSENYVRTALSNKVNGDILKVGDRVTPERLTPKPSLDAEKRYSLLTSSHMVKAVDVLDTVLNGKTISTKLAQFGSVGR